MNKEQIILIVGLSVVIALAAISVVHFAFGSSAGTGDWQCPDCAYKFSLKQKSRSVKCPKCDAEAARLIFRTCLKCKKKHLISRIRLTKESQEIIANTKGPPSPMMMPMDIQYWVKQSDGSYAWSDWMPQSSQQSQKNELDLPCPECGASPRDQFTSGVQE